MNIVKSFLVILVLLGITILTIYSIYHCIVFYRSGQRNVLWVLKTLFVSIVAICMMFLLGNYAYPFEREIKTELVSTLIIPEEYTLDTPGCEYWHAAYEAYGLYSGSSCFDAENPYPIRGLTWPEMDFENYTYIITYGQKINTLTYNVWEKIDVPIRTGAYVGHMILDEEFHANEAYVYRISKMRIDNNI